MFKRPDYEGLRESSGFRWFIGSSVYALLELTDTPLGAYNLNPDVAIEVYRKGRPLFRELYADADWLSMPSLHTPAISYGHVNGLGSELLFPDAGEVAHTHIYSSLAEGIAALPKPVDFAATGMAAFFLDYRERLRAAFPGESVGFSYGLEGPITTAYELRGDGFFLDLMDNPELAKTFLALVVASTNDFRKFLAEVNNTPVINPSGGGMCDDLASVVPARLFADLVLPAWKLFYQGVTTGTRTAHVEDLRAAQLPFLEAIGLSYFDPSISAKLNPKILFAECRVPFGWRLGSFHYLTMTCADVQDWVFQAVADGASSVFTHIERIMCREPQVAKVKAFAAAAQEAKSMLAGGASRADVGNCVSSAGQAKFWDHWPE